MAEAADNCVRELSRAQVPRARLGARAARADAARLGDALKETAVKLMVVEGNERWG